MLKTILIVTLSVLNLDTVETAYEEHFDYTVVKRGAVSEPLAAAWDAEAMAGKNYILMQAANETPVYIRFIENEPVEGYAPLLTQGWNATELLVQDTDALALELADSPFELVSEPADLWEAPNAPRAFQAIGPGDEVLYLTSNPDFVTTEPVDRVFIMVLGGPSLDALSRYYADTFGMGLGDPLQLPVPFMAEAHGVAADNLYPLRIAIISKDYLLELDEYPDSVGPRPVLPGHLPPGTSMVSFEAVDLDELDVTWRSAPAVVADFPYNGRRVGVTEGPAGEWIELVEAAAIP